MSKRQSAQGRIKLPKINCQKGAASIVLAVLLLGVLLIIGLSVFFITFQQLKASGETWQSVMAFYAADSGAERCLFAVRKMGAVSCSFFSVSLDNGAYYTTSYNSVISQIDSLGQFGEASRKIEISW